MDDATFRLIADNIPTLGGVANGDGYIVWYNRRWHEYCGTTPDQMEGWGWTAVHEPQRLPSVMERWTNSIASGEPFEMTFPLRGADGHFRQFLTRAIPLKNEEGRVVQWFGTNTDVDEITRAETALRESNQRMLLATEATGVGIWEWNVLTNALRWDAQMFRIYGIAPTKDGVVSYDDFKILADRFIELGHLTSKQKKDFVDALRVNYYMDLELTVSVLICKFCRTVNRVK